ncbi:cytidine deaminase-like protein [Cladorrhinum sp. PSN259]|nr:cytidine deaminase-like protein [Cladorrhinum sp. PSN259]
MINFTQYTFFPFLASILFNAVLSCNANGFLNPAPPPLAHQIAGGSSYVRLAKPEPEPTVINGIPYSVRAHWMREANKALNHPCPFAAFGSVVVNHTGSSAEEAGAPGELVCEGRNLGGVLGNPVMHGEITAITNCSEILTSPDGPYRLSPTQALAAFADLTLYTNAESCPMCASAIRWAGFKEYVYGTSINYLVEKGWGQIRISSVEVFERSRDLPRDTKVIGGVLTNETDGWFSWQFDEGVECPRGCERTQHEDDEHSLGTLCKSVE